MSQTGFIGSVYGTGSGVKGAKEGGKQAGTRYDRHVMKLSWKKVGMWGVLCAGAVTLAGCATPASRMKANPEMFQSFPLSVQENVKQGRIDIGYTRDMVFIAKGEPDRKYRRTSADGMTEVWSYVEDEIESEKKRVQGRFHFRDTNGRSRTATDDVWAEVQHRREYEKLRVILQADKVIAIERLRR